MSPISEPLPLFSIPNVTRPLPGYEIGPNCAIPTHFAGIIAIDFRHDEKFEEGFEELLRVVFDLPRFAPPPLGKSPSLSTTQYTRDPASNEQLHQNWKNAQPEIETTVSSDRPEKQASKQEHIPSKTGNRLYRADLILRWLKEHIRLASAVILMSLTLLAITLYLSQFNTPLDVNNVNVRKSVSSSNQHETFKGPHPVITAIRTDKFEITPGEQIRLIADILNPSNNELKYLWNASLGSIEGEGLRATLNTSAILPEKSPIYIKVSLRIVDDQGYSAVAEISIIVTPQREKNEGRAGAADRSDEIVIGDTDSSADAGATVKYLQSGRTRSPEYYVIDRDGKVILVWEERETVQHSSNTIYIQLAHEIGKEKYKKAQLASLINLLVDKVSKSRRLDINKIRTQQEIDPLHHTDLTKSIKGIRETVRGTITIFSSIEKE
jgi:hypothetical protein